MIKKLSIVSYIDSIALLRQQISKAMIEIHIEHREDLVVPFAIP